MYVLSITDDYDIISFSKCRDKENKVDITSPTLLLTIQCGISSLCLMRLLIWTTLKPLITIK